MRLELEDFDFLPMTDGLGFDKHAEEVKHKAIQSSLTPKSAKSEVKVSEPFIKPEDDKIVSRSLQKMLDSLPPSLDWAEDKDRSRDFKVPSPIAPTPVPMAPEVYKKPAPPLPVAKESYDVTLNNSIASAFPKTEFKKSFYHQTVTPQRQFKEVPVSFSSAIIDGLVALGLTGLFVVTLIVLTQIDVFKLVATNELMMRTGIELMALYFGVLVVYFMIARSLWGSTLGDWAFDIQLGTESERMHMMYPVQVFFRLTVIIATGIILIPFASIGFGKDIAKKFSGLNLYCRQY